MLLRSALPPLVLAPLVLLTLHTPIASAQERASAERRTESEQAPLGTAEIRVAQGLALGGGSGESTLRLSPLTLTALASYATITDPWISVYGGLMFEGNKRAAIGATLGLRLNPRAGRTRLSAAAVVIALPFTAYGASVGLGRCGRGVLGGAGICVDVEATVFGSGSDVPKGRIATQVQAVLGVTFDLF